MKTRKETGAMIKIKFKAVRGHLEWFVCFDLGAETDNNYAAIKYAWDHSAQIVST